MRDETIQNRPSHRDVFLDIWSLCEGFLLTLWAVKTSNNDRHHTISIHVRDASAYHREAFQVYL